MIRQRKGFKGLVLVILTDASAVSLALALVYWLRFHSALVPFVEGREGFVPADYYRLYPIFVAVWVISLYLNGLYRERQLLCGVGPFVRIVKASVLAVALVIAGDFFVRDTRFGYSRLAFVMALGSGVFWLTVFRWALRRALSRGALPVGAERINLAILGTGPLAHYVAGRVRSQPFYGYHLVGFIATSPQAAPQVAEGQAEGSPAADRRGGCPLLGMLSDLPAIIRAHNIQEIFVTQSDLEPERILNLILECEKDLVEVRIVPNLLEMMVTEITLDELEGVPLCSLKETPLQGVNALIKRVFDIVASALGLAVLAVPMAVIAWLIKRDSPGPVFYKQERIGADGRVFWMLKFRSMRADAEAATGPVWSSNDDPRVTRVGRWLRRFNLDELPQLINVLRGDMSLVGPRPERPFFVDKFKHQIPRYMARHRVKSGITGWAQVHGLRGAHTPLTERVRYDLYYIENWTFWLDLKILLMTFFSQRRVV
ncbi:MAG: undecaprenyl-phosphate glucose phosphotransferase [Candidatus Sumerlaeia bacterium]